MHKMSKKYQRGYKALNIAMTLYTMKNIIRNNFNII